MNPCGEEPIFFHRLVFPPKPNPSIRLQIKANEGPACKHPKPRLSGPLLFHYSFCYSESTIIPVSIALTPEAQKNTTAAETTTIANPKIEDLPPCPYDEVDPLDRLNPNNLF